LIEQVLNQVVALAIGLALGFYFDRRASRGIREQNKELRKELEALRNSIYSVGGSSRPTPAERSPKPDELAREIVEFARGVQDAEGRVRRSILVERFLSRGLLPADITRALDLAEQAGSVQVQEKWITLR
jgi:CHASE2 domain-containing sensor protein